MRNLGVWVWAVGIVALGLVGLAFGNLEGGQTAPKATPDRAVLVAIANAFLVVAGAAAPLRGARRWAAAALALWWVVVVTVLMAASVILLHPDVFGAWSGAAEVMAVGTAAIIVWAGTGVSGEAAWVRGAQATFGICAVLFGVAHFVYMGLTAPLVPRWLPGSGVFWGYATGVAQVAAGVAIATRIAGRLAAVLLTTMYGLFQLLVHMPLLIGAPGSEFFWSENALNLTLVGVAWVVAASFQSVPRASVSTVSA
jgi:hypothetical protein